MSNFARLLTGRTALSDPLKSDFTSSALWSAMNISEGAALPIDALTITAEQDGHSATPEQIGLYMTPTRTVGAGSVSVRYRPSSGGQWANAHPLLRIMATGSETDGVTTLVDSFGGTIFDLQPNTQYDIELTHAESGQQTKVSTIQRTTRALPAAAGAPNRTANSVATIGTQFGLVNAGDVLEIAAGTYNVAGLVLARSGNAAAPIYIRGASRTLTVLRDTSGTVMEIDASNIILENLTIEGSSVDSGIASTSLGLLIGGERTNITVREINMVGVDQGIVCDSAVTGALVYQNDLRGNNPWSEASNGNATWNDDGVNIPGFGNACWNNTLKGFGDSFAVNQSPNIVVLRAEGIYFYRNRVLNNGDDLIEFDYGTRNIGCYDNLVTNTGTAMSVSYQYGGPAYYFRNIVVNTIRGPYKINGGGIGNTGFLIYNNTIVRTDGTTGFGMYETGINGAWQNFSFRNNLLVYRGTGPVLVIDQPDNDPCDFDFNAWFQPAGDTRFRWTSNYYATLAAAKTALASLPVTPVFGSSSARQAHDVLTVTNPFASAITLGADHTTEYVATPDATLSGSGPKGLGVAIPGITDGFNGGAPDIGAAISGRPGVVYGASTLLNFSPQTVGVVLATHQPVMLVTGPKVFVPSAGIITLAGQQPSTTQGGFPAWVNNLSVLTWTQLSNTRPSLVGADNPGVTAYSGAAYDPTRRLYIFNGGGHNDGAGNGVFAVRVGRDAPDVVALRANSASAQSGVPYYNDGLPSARHTYGTLTYYAPLDSVMQVGCAAPWLSGGGYQDGTLNSFYLNTNAWSTIGDFTSYSATYAGPNQSACVGAANRIYTITHSDTDVARYIMWTPTAVTYAPGTWTLLDSGWSGRYGGLRYDSARDRLVCFDNIPGYWTGTSGTRTGISVQNTYNVSAYCVERDSFFTVDAAAGNPAVVREIPAASYGSGSVVSIAGTAPTFGAGGYGNDGIHNRIQIDETLGVIFVHCGTGATDLYAFRYK